MNINDVKMKDLGIDTSDKLNQIFHRQLELMKTYHTIEKDNGLMATEDVPVSLHDAKGQYRLKDFAWRITEELGEALEARREHADLRDHYDEEIADALHFLVEFTILSGMSPIDILGFYNPPQKDGLDILFERCPLSRNRNFPVLCRVVGETVLELATACNCLKNKPWKMTRMVTDEAYFRSKVRSTWRSFIDLCVVSGIDQVQLFNLYFQKSEVNKFRQRSNY